MPQTRTAERRFARQDPTRQARPRPSRLARIAPDLRFIRRAFLVFLALPLALRLIVATVLIILVWSAVNWAYQVIRKPTELYFR